MEELSHGAMASGETAADSMTADLASAHGQRTVCFTPGFCTLWETHKRKWYYVQNCISKL